MGLVLWNSTREVKNHPEILPASLDLVEYEKDVRLAIASGRVKMRPPGLFRHFAP
jgi:hypothetical protein